MQQQTVTYVAKYIHTIIKTVISTHYSPSRHATINSYLCSKIIHTHILYNLYILDYCCQGINNQLHNNIKNRMSTQSESNCSATKLCLMLLFLLLTASVIFTPA